MALSKGLVVGGEGPRARAVDARLGPALLQILSLRQEGDSGDAVLFHPWASFSPPTLLLCLCGVSSIWTGCLSLAPASDSLRTSTSSLLCYSE